MADSARSNAIAIVGMAAGFPFHRRRLLNTIRNGVEILVAPRTPSSTPRTSIPSSGLTRDT
jgi:hypothetical protein